MNIHPNAETMRQRIELAKSFTTWEDYFKAIGVDYDSPGNFETYRRYGIVLLSKSELIARQRVEVAKTSTSWSDFFSKINMPNSISNRKTCRQYGIDFQPEPKKSRVDWDHRRQVAATCSTWKECFAKLGMTRKSSSESFKAHGITFTDNPNRLYITEEEWQHRREVAATCLTWSELYPKLGMSPLTSNTRFRARGVKILCWNCRKNLADKIAYQTLYIRSFCTPCYDKLYKEKKIHLKHERNFKLSNRLTFAKSDDDIPEILACGLAHNSEIQARKNFKEAADLEEKYKNHVANWISHDTNGFYCKTCDLSLNESAIKLKIELLKKEAYRLLENSTDPDNPFTDPVFLRKLLDVK